MALQADKSHWFLAGGGEAGKRVRACDWTRTPLGDPAHWPPTLRHAVSLVLNSNQPMFAVWGPQRTLIYNDGYAPILGNKHPAAMGRPFLEVWSEIAHVVMPIVDKGFAGIPTSMDDIALVMLRHGEPEETHFSFSYTPLREEKGQVGGILCACTEITDRVRSMMWTDQAPVMVWITDFDNQTTYLSKTWYDFTGQTPQTGLGLGWLDAVHEADRERTREIFMDAARQRIPFRIEFRGRQHDGAYRWMLDTGTPRFSDDQQWLGYIGSVIDIDERKRAEQELLNSEARLSLANERLQSTLDNITDGIFALDGDWRFTRFAASGSAAAHVWPDEIVDQCLWDVFPHAKGTLFEEHYLRARQTGQPVHFEAFYPEPLNSWFECHCYPDDDNLIVHFRDITERKNAEVALRESEMQLRRVLDNLFAFVGLTSPDGTVLQANRAPLEAAGITAQDVVGKKFWDTYWWSHSPQLQAQVRESVQRAARGELVRYDVQVRMVNDTRMWIDFQLAPLRDSQGRITHLIPSAMDVTKRKAAESELRQSRDELEERVRQRTAELQHRADQLARLTSQLTLSEQRERRRLAQILHDHLQQLLVASRFRLDMLTRQLPTELAQAARQIDQLLVDSVAASRSLTVELSPPILHEVGLVAGLQWLARRMKEKHDVRVEVQVEGTVRVDREDIRVLMFVAVRELIHNAIKHAAVKEIRVALAIREDRLCVVVEDAGSGFDPTISLSRESTPQGFGLFTIRERIEFLGGSFEARSAPGQGATFTLCVPQNTPSVQPPPAAPDLTPPAAYEQILQQVKDGDGRARILLVDDHAVLRQGLRSLISREKDIEVIAEAGDGTEAIALARQYCPDVILMDFSMPQMDGVEATRIIHAELPHIRIIGLSMYAEADRAKAMLNAGASAYLQKTGESRELVETIRRLRGEPRRNTSRT